MAHVKQNKFHKKKKNRANKVHLVFDEEKRRDYLTGFHKRKLQRKKEAIENLEKELKEERKRLKTEAKESYKKLVVSHRPIPELEHLHEDEYEDEEVTVKVVELSTNELAKENNWIGPNQPKYDQSEDEESEEEEAEEMPGMALKHKAPKKKEKKVVKQTFNSEKDVKRILKKQATKNVQKSKAFQMKSKMERQKQRKKSNQQKMERIKLRSKKTKFKGRNQERGS